jgi:hypothetical protein
MRLCIHCGAEFNIGGSKKKKYCSSKCRYKSFELRHPDRHPNRWIRLHDHFRAKVSEAKDFIYADKILKGCSRCSERRPNCLQYHHLDPSKKTCNISDIQHRRYTLKRIEEEMAKCIILCANCHAIEENGDGFRAGDRLKIYANGNS